MKRRASVEAKSAGDGVAWWIVFSAWCSLSGLILSELGMLHRGGYAVALLLLVAACFFFRADLGLSVASLMSFCRRLRPRRRWLPRIWWLLAVLVFVGGLLHPPNNFDYLTYRFPRVLHWWWDQKWTWIATVDPRMNYSGTGMEWMMAPLFIFFKTDRLFFLLNFIPFLLLPGLVFSVFQGLGLSRRWCWWWMWILPSGYCYVLQAASMGNDSIGAFYLLAAFHFVFRAAELSARRDLFLSCLAIALATGVKTSNLPLVLPWLLAVFFYGKPWRERTTFPVWIAVLPMAAAVSFLPMALRNIEHTGTYTGDPDNEGRLQVANPVSGIAGNSLQMAVDNLTPPLWPRPINFAGIISPGWRARLQHDFPRFLPQVGEMQIEEEAGLGLGVVACAVLVTALGLRTAWRPNGTPRYRKVGTLPIVVGGAIALLAFMAKMGSESTSRLVAAYYPLLIGGVAVLTALDGRHVRHALVRFVGCAALLSALPLVIFSPARPLFPVAMTEEFFARIHPMLSDRLDRVYGVYASRYDAQQSLVTLIPTGENTIGAVLGGDVPQPSLWRPFGARQVIELFPETAAKVMKKQGIRFVIVDGDALAFLYHLTIADFAQRLSAAVVVEKNLTLKAQSGPQPWYLLRCSP